MLNLFFFVEYFLKIHRDQGVLVMAYRILLEIAWIDGVRFGMQSVPCPHFLGGRGSKGKCDYTEFFGGILLDQCLIVSY